MLRLKLTMCFHSPVVGAVAVRLREIPGPAPDGCKRAMKPWPGAQPFNSQAFFQDPDLLDPNVPLTCRSLPASFRQRGLINPLVRQRWGLRRFGRAVAWDRP